MSNYSDKGEVLSSRTYYQDGSLRQLAAKQRNYVLMKRILDVAASCVGLLLCTFLFFAIAVLIKLEDPKGTVFFRQIRVGKDGKHFYMYKFRSMVWNAEELLNKLMDKNEIQGAMFKMKDDPRITKIGKILRVTSLDELPQLWNVLKGDMSLVGPRPPLPREVEQYSAYDRQRLTVIPGCTGLWQVSGRNGLSFEQMVELDLYYIQNRTIWFDIKLIFKTVWVMLFPNNAY
ncbi:sugar transferase [Paenibacillus allorhizosphaerae]|uniref:Sugar transferase EpsL n=1 Tax=Paenibacillus allorhizosphaerae TaxID=2849866 RepID=A0ABM8VEV4_9BACL|nr:sugar transferase [Paenibacillus allorhizosphaerae]CAG7632505.1 putative sugar transferase EpsL [Paenibacillus allorhizosphaerae]